MAGPECSLLLGPYRSSQNIQGLVCHFWVELTVRDTLPEELRPALLSLLLSTLSTALLNPSPLVIRKIYGSVSGRCTQLIDRFSSVKTTLSPISQPDNYRTSDHRQQQVGPGVVWDLRRRAGEGRYKRSKEVCQSPVPADVRKALQRHLDGDMPAVMSLIMESLRGPQAEDACKCAESWVGYGISGE